MTDDKDAEIDPRFDPAFQRGFDPGIPIEEYVPEPLPRRSDSPAPASVGIVPPAAPVPPVPTPDRAGEVRSAAPAAEPLEEPAASVSAAGNPFLVFLGVIAIVLVVGGIWLFVRTGDAFDSKEVQSQGDYMSLDAIIHMAPFIALLGAATAIGVLFVFAAKWRGRR